MPSTAARSSPSTSRRSLSAGGAIVAAEALARWRHPQRGLVPAEEFIPLAEATGSIHGIGRFMLDECLAALDRWRSDGVSIGLSVNVSTLQLAGSTFTDYLGEQLRAATTSRTDADASRSPSRARSRTRTRSCPASRRLSHSGSASPWMTSEPVTRRRASWKDCP